MGNNFLFLWAPPTVPENKVLKCEQLKSMHVHSNCIGNDLADTVSKKMPRLIKFLLRLNARSGSIVYKNNIHNALYNY